MKRFTYFLLLAAFSVFVFEACSKLEEKKAENTPEITNTTAKVFASPKELVDDAKQRIKEITKDELKAKMESGAKFYIIDVREPDEWESGACEKAVRIPRGLLEFKLTKIIPEITKDDEIVLYCKKGDRSTLAADALRSLGYTKVFALKGGWNEFMGIKEEAPAEQPAGDAKPQSAKPAGGGC